MENTWREKKGEECLAASSSNSKNVFFNILFLNVMCCKSVILKYFCQLSHCCGASTLWFWSLSPQKIPINLIYSLAVYKTHSTLETRQYSVFEGSTSSFYNFCGTFLSPENESDATETQKFVSVCQTGLKNILCMRFIFVIVLFHFLTCTCVFACVHVCVCCRWKVQ